MIVSPYNRNNPLPYSQITCLVISDEISPDGSYRKFSTKTILLLLSFFFWILQITEFIPVESNLMEKFLSSTRESLFAYHVVQPPSFLLWFPSALKFPLCYHGHWAKTLQCRESLWPSSVCVLGPGDIAVSKTDKVSSVLLKILDKCRLAFSAMTFKWKNNNNEE